MFKVGRLWQGSVNGREERRQNEEGGEGAHEPVREITDVDEEREISEEPEEDIEFVVVIGEEELALAKNAKQGEKIEITYSYDLSGKVHCIFEETKSGKKTELSLKPEGSKTFKDLKDNLDFDIE